MPGCSSSRLASAVVAAVEAVVGDAPRPVLLHAPDLRGQAEQYVSQCIRTNWVSSAGAFVDRFEADLARYTGSPRVVAVSSGTAALQVALQLVGVGSGDEVLMPSLTFVATANACSYRGAVPHFVDVEQQRLGLDPAAVRARLDEVADRRGNDVVNRQTGRRIAAIVPMHAFGHPVDLTPLMDLAGEWGLPLVEDAAESLGSFIGDRHTGTLGRVGILSFNGNKIVTTGGGGAILAADDELADRARHLTTTAKQPHRWAFFHDAVGYNFRMPNLNAALGCGQLERLPAMLERKRQLAGRYREVLSAIDQVGFVDEPLGCTSNYWLNAIVLDEAAATARDVILDQLAERQIQARPIWEPMHQLPMYAACPRGPLPVTKSLAKRVINLPSSATLAEVSA